ncbi:MAG: hypothetical protein ACP5NG_01850 [Conexivisphaera sp.]
MRSADRLGLLAQTAYMAGVAGAAALLSSPVDRAYLAPQESLGLSFLPAYLSVALAASAAAAYYVVRHYRGKLRTILDAYTVLVTFASALELCAYSGACATAALGLGVAAAVAAAVAVGLRRPRTRSASYTAAGVLVGILLALFVPFSWTPYVLLAFAAYDALAVTRGPLRSIPADMDVLMVDVGDVRIGLGDVAFYSFAASSLELSRGPAWALAAVAAVAAGSAITLAILRRVNRPVPGLTIPLALCALLMFI